MFVALNIIFKMQKNLSFYHIWLLRYLHFPLPVPKLEYSQYLAYATHPIWALVLLTDMHSVALFVNSKLQIVSWTTHFHRRGLEVQLQKSKEKHRIQNLSLSLPHWIYISHVVNRWTNSYPVVNLSHPTLLYAKIIQLFQSPHNDLFRYNHEHN